MGLLFSKRTHFDPHVLRTLFAAIVCAAIADTAFTQYLSDYGISNLAGHLFLFFSAFLIYRAIVVTGIQEPAALLFRKLELSREALRTTEERLRFAMEACHIGAWEFDLVEHTIYRSLEHDRIFGYAELLPRWTLETFLQHALPEYRAEVEAMVRRATSAQSSWTYECRIRRADGEIRWIWFSGHHLTDFPGHNRMAGIVQDITERKLAEEKIREAAKELQVTNRELDDSRRAAINLLEEALIARRQAEQVAAALQESEEQFHTLADAIPQLCWMANGDGWIFWYNKRWYDYTGTTPAQMEGWGWQSVHDPEVLPEVIKRWQVSLSTGKIFDMVFPLRGSDGVFRPFLTRGMPVCDQNDKIVRWFGTNTDISEQRKTKDALQQAHSELAKQMEKRTRELREKEVLLKEIHHRVKNNLQVISSLVSLQADSAGDETTRAGLKDVMYRVRSMALVHEKLYQAADLAQIDFAEYTRSLLNYLWRAHGSAAASVGLTLDLEPLSLPVDIAVPCGLILNELVGNTLKHAFRERVEGKVTVALECAGDRTVRLRVHDDGIGLPPGLDWRNSSSLGLRLVQMLAGQLHATAELNRDGGTEFQITFKLPKEVKDGEKKHG
jgi:PAS domain S-box-containing protein